MLEVKSMELKNLEKVPQNNDSQIESILEKLMRFLKVRVLTFLPMKE